MRRGVIMALLCFTTAQANAESFEEHDFILSCSGCHRIDGRGSRDVPSLHDMRELADRPGAREYWVRVPGAAQAPLSNERLAALMNWLVARFTARSPDPPYTSSEVARLRAKPLRDPLAVRKRISASPTR
jgi:hypothetical protein